MSRWAPNPPPSCRNCRRVGSDFASLATLLSEYRAELADGLVAKNARLDDIGIDAYLADRGAKA